MSNRSSTDTCTWRFFHGFRASRTHEVWSPLHIWGLLMIISKYMTHHYVLSHLHPTKVLAYICLERPCGALTFIIESVVNVTGPCARMRIGLTYWDSITTSSTSSPISVITLPSQTFSSKSWNWTSAETVYKNTLCIWYLVLSRYEYIHCSIWSQIHPRLVPFLSL